MALATTSACSEAPPAAPTVLQGSSVAVPGRSCAPPQQLASSPTLPARFALPAGAIVTAGAATGEQTVLTGQVASSVEQVLAHFRRSVDDAGFVLQRDEDEGRSAVLEFFAANSEGSVVIARQTCPRGVIGFTVRLRQPG